MVALISSYLALLAFLVAVSAPCVTMRPSFGGGAAEWVAAQLDPKSTEPQTYSMLGGISHLLRDGDWLIGGVLVVFTLLFPILKLVMNFYLLHASAAHAERIAVVLGHLGKWSMLDVFVIAAIVVSFKSFPLGSRVETRWGILLFAVSVVLSMIATWMLKRHLHHDSRVPS
jgi:uncharacterized paraquat-inducible protein A